MLFGSTCISRTVSCTQWSVWDTRDRRQQAFNTIDDFHLLQWADVTKPLEGAISFGNCRLWGAECPG